MYLFSLMHTGLVDGNIHQFRVTRYFKGTNQKVGKDLNLSYNSENCSFEYLPNFLKPYAKDLIIKAEVELSLLS